MKWRGRDSDETFGLIHGNQQARCAEYDMDLFRHMLHCVPSVRRAVMEEKVGALGVVGYRGKEMAVSHVQSTEEDQGLLRVEKLSF
ncbi:hypothetical protein FisN_UnNu009 [Fistulifera solaris]|uniref:Uncharacterized protein n=1 Tax=Fistulifera solaris TaxID=1519565 RepID=A0A1Z5J9Y3_FISSO|nr:hypothetical protein FisN_UnNu009 [Fistulifera solaris]|eukprot:GAX10776.1 hypothetical protein FisN_UnNu009 [Fistulifera solaris]